MAVCGNCGAIHFLGVKRGGKSYCNSKCAELGPLVEHAAAIPDEFLDYAVAATHQGACPRCGSEGPVDIHLSHRVMSFLVLTSYSSTPRLACRACARGYQIRESILSLILGWWGFPWGLVMTPVQISRNVVGMFRGPSPNEPSAQLRNFVQLAVAAQMAAAAPSECAKCGYNLTGNVSGYCPECGEWFAQAPTAEIINKQIESKGSA